jgi:flagellar protein FlaG
MPTPSPGDRARSVAMDIQQVQRLTQVPQALDVVSVEKRTPEQKGLIEAVAKVNKSGLLGQDKELTFQMDRETGRTVIRVVNRQTREVIQQTPPEYVLEVAKALEQVK